MLEGYGQTEAIGLTINGLECFDHRQGSVGAPVVHLRIVNCQGATTHFGQVGEVVVKGPMVVDSYLDDPEESAARFRDGWLYTGDLGKLDEDGFLTIVGRIRDIINRGGEKIAPIDVEDVLRQHPAVADAVVFPIPDAILGEEVAVAVRLRKGQRLTQRDLRRFGLDHLSAWKVPKVVVFVDSFPETSTGKVPRTRLAELFGLNDQPAQVPLVPYEAPASKIEEQVATIFKDQLDVERIGRNDSFFDLGGDSLGVVRLVDEVKRLTGATIAVSSVYRRETVAGISESVSRTLGHLEGERIPEPNSSSIPLVNVYYPNALRELLPYLDSRVELVDIVDPATMAGSLAADDIASIARRCVEELRSVGSRGPFLIAGYSLGAAVAFETAVLLQEAGERIAGVILVDVPAPTATPPYLQWLNLRLQKHATAIQRMSAVEAAAYLAQKLGVFVRMTIGVVVGNLAGQLARPVPRWARSFTSHPRLLFRSYRPRRFSGPVVVFRALDQEPGRIAGGSRTMGWSEHVDGEIEANDIRADHSTIVVGPAAHLIAYRINDLARRFLRTTLSEAL